MIKPTVGRMLHYYPASEDSGAIVNCGHPLAATIAHVWNDRCINIAYLDTNGVWRSKTSVLLVHEDDEARPGACYCVWMPYQKGQASKTDAVQRDALDALLDTRVPILDQLTELCWAIEKCGASPELTDAVTRASALRKPITELVRQALTLGIGAGIVSVNVSPELSPAAGDVAVTSQVVTSESLAPSISLLLASADCCDTNAAARDDMAQAEQDRTNAASYRLAANLLQV